MTKRIVLCADDYGQALGISEGILSLVKAGRLTAASCMVTSPYWEASARMMQSFEHQAQWGLHFNLTEGGPLSPGFRQHYGYQFPSLSKLIALASLRLLRQDLVEQELHAQLSQFEDSVGRLPDFLDGHQHVHQFPVIREAVMRVYRERLPKSTHVRSVVPIMQLVDPKLFLKKWVIMRMGAKPFLRLLEQHHIPHNSSFSGIYDFAQADTYRAWFKQFVLEIKDGGMMMVHPGQPESKVFDPIATARYQELEYLASDLFLKDCEGAGVEIQRVERT